MLKSPCPEAHVGLTNPSGLKAICVMTLVTLTACGGGGGGGGGSSAPQDPQLAAKQAAASSVAQDDANECAAIRPFYWEVGDSSGALVSGSVASATDPTTYQADTRMNIASASKWLYASYVAEVRQGHLNSTDVAHLSFRSGYTNFNDCLRTQTVGSCATYQENGTLDPSHVGLFFYNSGHMQVHANNLGLGELDNEGLATEIMRVLGTDLALSYTQPQLAGGGVTSADGYRHFLMKLLAGQLQITPLLGSHSVCANPDTCPESAASGGDPIFPAETWHYSLGHWVENDPQVGDGAFSSPGAFGFYPWIDASKRYYGIVARTEAAAAMDSVSCGRLIRKAWLNATP